LAVRAVACLGGFPAIIFPISKALPLLRRSQKYNVSAKVFNYEDNIDNCIVNNLEWSYRSKKRADDSLYRDRAKGGERDEKRSQEFCHQD
jgi:hypothetical protein